MFALCPEQWKAHDWGDIRVNFLLRNLHALRRSLAERNVPLYLLRANMSSMSAVGTRMSMSSSGAAADLCARSTTKPCFDRGRCSRMMAALTASSRHFVVDATPFMRARRHRGTAHPQAPSANPPLDRTHTQGAAPLRRPRPAGALTGKAGASTRREHTVSCLSSPASKATRSTIRTATRARRRRGWIIHGPSSITGKGGSAYGEPSR